MRLGRLLMLVAVLIVVGGGAIFAVIYFGDGFGGGEPEVTPIPTGSVVMISQPVTRGERLTPEKLFVTQLPVNNILDTMFAEVSEVEGWIARYDMDPATILTANMIVEDPGMLGNDGGSDHALLIPEGKVAFPIPISRFSSVAFGLSQGDRVNVIATMMFVDLDQQFQTLLPNNTANILPPGQGILLGIESYKDGDSSTSAQFITGEGLDDIDLGLENTVAQILSSGSAGQTGRAELDAVLNLPFYVVPSEDNQRPRLVSQTVLQGAYVLQMGTFPEYITIEESEEDLAADPAAAAGTEADPAAPVAPAAPQAPPPPDIVTLIVTPQEAVTLNYLLYTGAEITLALRSAVVDPDIPTSAVTLEFLMNTYNIPLPNRLNYGLDPRLEMLEEPVLTNDIPTPEPNN